MDRLLPIERFRELAGTRLEPSPWFEVDQDRIDAFAEATEDRQFLHVDPARAVAAGLGGTIAHGFLTLSLLPKLLEESMLLPRGLERAINYGIDRVRWIEPVPSGSRVRARGEVVEVTERRPGRFLVTVEVEVEIEGRQRPALAARTLGLFVCSGEG